MKNFTILGSTFRTSIPPPFITFRASAVAASSLSYIDLPVAAPSNFGTPVISITLGSMRRTFAPMAFVNSMRLSTSGSSAAFLIVTIPELKIDPSISDSVPV